MPVPDFEQLARQIFMVEPGMPTGDALESDVEQGIIDLTEQLRRVWNARGAADLAAVEKEGARSEAEAADMWETIPIAIKSLDR